VAGKLQAIKRRVYRLSARKTEGVLCGQESKSPDLIRINLIIVRRLEGHSKMGKINIAEAYELLGGGREGVKEWNKRRRLGEAIPDLSEARLAGLSLFRANLTDARLANADLSGVRLSHANLSNATIFGARLPNARLTGANLRGAYMARADLTIAHLRGADLQEAYLTHVTFRKADLSGANLSNANLLEADLTGADLSGANLSGANLQRARLVDTNLSYADLSGARVYGISAWNVNLAGTNQSNLLLTSIPGYIGQAEEPLITVDNLDVAQFIYLLLNNEKIRDVINSITTKLVLILGRFSTERKAVLDAMRLRLRELGYCPILFDFGTPSTRDTHETLTTLARLSRFVVADITDPRSVPQELVGIVESLPSVPVQPILMSGEELWGMYDHIKRYPWVLGIHYYSTKSDLMGSFLEKIVQPAEAKAQHLSLA
jgi:uncharacterized protein YjbI with pentapeptide repeats